MGLCPDLSARQINVSRAQTRAQSTFGSALAVHTELVHFSDFSDSLHHISVHNHTEAGLREVPRTGDYDQGRLGGRGRPGLETVATRRVQKSQTDSVILRHHRSRDAIVGSLHLSLAFVTDWAVLPWQQRQYHFLDHIRLLLHVRDSRAYRSHSVQTAQRDQMGHAVHTHRHSVHHSCVHCLPNRERHRVALQIEHCSALSQYCVHIRTVAHCHSALDHLCLAESVQK